MQVHARGEARLNCMPRTMHGIVWEDEDINPAPDLFVNVGPPVPTAGPGNPGNASDSQNAQFACQNQPRRPNQRGTRGYFVFRGRPQKDKNIKVGPHSRGTRPTAGSKYCRAGFCLWMSSASTWRPGRGSPLVKIKSCIARHSIYSIYI